jgi:hypothetical protein
MPFPPRIQSEAKKQGYDGPDITPRYILSSGEGNAAGRSLSCAALSERREKHRTWRSMRREGRDVRGLSLKREPFEIDNIVAVRGGGAQSGPWACQLDLFRTGPMENYCQTTQGGYS